jgi:hypothetical protein
MDWASEVGRQRMLRSLIHKRVPNFEERYPGEMWATHILAAGAELAVARFLGVDWPATVDTFRAADIGSNIEVRLSPRRSDTKVRLDDRASLRIVGVTGTLPEYTIMGWIRAFDAKQPQWKHTASKPHCYFVPHAELTPFTNRGSCGPE